MRRRGEGATRFSVVEEDSIIWDKIYKWPENNDNKTDIKLIRSREKESIISNQWTVKMTITKTVRWSARICIESTQQQSQPHLKKKKMLLWSLHIKKMIIRVCRVVFESQVRWIPQKILGFHSGMPLYRYTSKCTCFDNSSNIISNEIQIRYFNGFEADETHSTKTQFANASWRRI